jgi:hypothetical protein
VPRTLDASLEVRPCRYKVPSKVLESKEIASSHQKSSGDHTTSMEKDEPRRRLQGVCEREPGDLQPAGTRGLRGRGVRSAQTMQVGPCIPAGVPLQRAEVGPTSGPARYLSYSVRVGSGCIVVSETAAPNILAKPV